MRIAAASGGAVAGARTSSTHRPATIRLAPPITSALIGVPAEKRLQQEAEQARRDQLRDHDEEIEDAHVHAHLRRRHAVGRAARTAATGSRPRRSRRRPSTAAASADRGSTAIDSRPSAAEQQIDQVAHAQAEPAHHRAGSRSPPARRSRCRRRTARRPSSRPRCRRPTWYRCCRSAPRSPRRWCRSTSRTARTRRRTAPPPGARIVGGMSRRSSMMRRNRRCSDDSSVRSRKARPNPANRPASRYSALSSRVRRRSRASAAPTTSAASAACAPRAGAAAAALRVPASHRRRRPAASGGYSRVRSTVQAIAPSSTTRAGVERVAHGVRDLRRPARCWPRRTCASSHGSRLATTEPTPMKKLCIA